MNNKERTQQKRHKALIGDVFDLIRGRHDFTSPKTFTDKYKELEIDYNSLSIKVDKKYSLKLIISE